MRGGDRLRLGWGFRWIQLWVVRVGAFVEAHGVGAGRSRAAAARREDELSWLVRGGRDEEHVACGSVEELAEDLRGAGRAVAAEDPLFGDAAGDGDSGELRDLVKDLIEAGVIGGDGELVVEIGDSGVICGGGRRWRWGTAGGRSKLRRYWKLSRGGGWKLRG